MQERIKLFTLNKLPKIGDPPIRITIPNDCEELFVQILVHPAIYTNIEKIYSDPWTTKDPEEYIKLDQSYVTWVDSNTFLIDYSYFTHLREDDSFVFNVVYEKYAQPPRITREDLNRAIDEYALAFAEADRLRLTKENNLLTLMEPVNKALKRVDLILNLFGIKEE